MKQTHTLFLALLWLSDTAQADVMLLVHGYLGDATSWEKSGITQELHQQGWGRAGIFTGSPYGPQLYLAKHDDTDNLTYVASLPSIAPVTIQADVLKITIDIIKQRHQNEKIIIVGHSAGGIVARMALVRHRLKNIKALITIATPHIGTARADQALNITRNQGPFNMVKEFVGGSDYNTLKHSRELMFDLRHPQPGNMLYWLNTQPHPDIHYASIIRLDNNGVPGDYYVPGFSQDMNNVPALQGRSWINATPTSHFLTRQDANTILAVISHF